MPCDDCTEGMYWTTGEEDNCRLGSRAASVPRGWLVGGGGSLHPGGIRRVRRPPAIWSHRGAGARMPIPLGEESAFER